MNCLKPLLCLVSVLAASLGAAPVIAAAPEPFTLGAPAPVAASLPAAPGVKSTASKPAAKPAAKAAKAKATAKAKAGKPVATKSKSRKSADVIATDVPAAKLDLSLPKDMVNQLQPPGKVSAAAKPASPQAGADGKPLLPSLFAPKDGAEPFQLNGRLLTNEMDLQLRNESRREVDGAALDFKFKQ